jgi:hypothetical protein
VSVDKHPSHDEEATTHIAANLLRKRALANSGALQEERARFAAKKQKEKELSLQQAFEAAQIGKGAKGMSKRAQMEKGQQEKQRQRRREQEKGGGEGTEGGADLTRVEERAEELMAIREKERQQAKEDAEREDQEEYDDNGTLLMTNQQKTQKLNQQKEKQIKEDRARELLEEEGGVEGAAETGDDEQGNDALLSPRPVASRYGFDDYDDNGNEVDGHYNDDDDGDDGDDDDDDDDDLLMAHQVRYMEQQKEAAARRKLQQKAERAAKKAAARQSAEHTLMAAEDRLATELRAEEVVEERRRAHAAEFFALLLQSRQRGALGRAVVQRRRARRKAEAEAKVKARARAQQKARMDAAEAKRRQMAAAKAVMENTRLEKEAGEERKRKEADARELDEAVEAAKVAMVATVKKAEEELDTRALKEGRLRVMLEHVKVALTFLQQKQLVNNRDYRIKKSMERKRQVSMERQISTFQFSTGDAGGGGGGGGSLSVTACPPLQQHPRRYIIKQARLHYDRWRVDSGFWSEAVVDPEALSAEVVRVREEFVLRKQEEAAQQKKEGELLQWEEQQQKKQQQEESKKKAGAARGDTSTSGSGSGGMKLKIDLKHAAGVSRFLTDELILHEGNDYRVEKVLERKTGRKMARIVFGAGARSVSDEEITSAVKGYLARAGKNRKKEEEKQAAEANQEDGRTQLPHELRQLRDKAVRREEAKIQRAKQEEEDICAAVVQAAKDEKERLVTEGRGKMTREMEEHVRKAAVMEAEELAKHKAEEQARKEVEEQARKEPEEQARKEAEEQAKKEAEEQARKEAGERLRAQLGQANKAVDSMVLLGDSESGSDDEAYDEQNSRSAEAKELKKKKREKEREQASEKESQRLVQDMMGEKAASEAMDQVRTEEGERLRLNMVLGSAEEELAAGMVLLLDEDEGDDDDKDYGDSNEEANKKEAEEQERKNEEEVKQKNEENERAKIRKQVQVKEAEERKEEISDDEAARRTAEANSSKEAEAEAGERKEAEEEAQKAAEEEQEKRDEEERVQQRAEAEAGERKEAEEEAQKAAEEEQEKRAEEERVQQRAEAEAGERKEAEEEAQDTMATVSFLPERNKGHDASAMFTGTSPSDDELEELLNGGIRTDELQETIREVFGGEVPHAGGGECNSTFGYEDTDVELVLSDEGEIDKMGLCSPQTNTTEIVEEHMTEFVSAGRSLLFEDDAGSAVGAAISMGEGTAVAGGGGVCDECFEELPQHEPWCSCVEAPL